MKTILITGASGFLGSHLIKALHKHYKIIGLKRKNSNLWRLKGYDVELVDNLHSIEKGVDCIIHTATNYGRNGDLISEIVDCNILFSLRLLEFAKANDIESFIYANTLQNPLASPYCMSKNHLDSYFRYFDSVKIIDICIEHMYGPFDDNNKFVHYLIEQMVLDNPIELSEGTQMRDFVYIDDVVEGFRIVIKNMDTFAMRTHLELGSGKQTRLRDFARLSLEIFNRYQNTKSRLLFGARESNPFENMNIRADISPLKALGYAPRYSAKEGIARTIAHILHRGGG